MHEAYRDAEDVQDDDLLLRRITPSQHIDVQPDGTEVLTSFAFRERNCEPSLYVAKEVTHEKVLSCGFPTQKIVEIPAGGIRSRGYVIVRQPDDCDDSHVFAKARSQKSGGQIVKDCKAFAEIVNARNAAGSPQN